MWHGEGCEVLPGLSRLYLFVYLFTPSVLLVVVLVLLFQPLFHYLRQKGKHSDLLAEPALFTSANTREGGREGGMDGRTD